MPPGRSIPRPPASRPKKPKPPAEGEIPVDLQKSSGELVALSSRIRACTACDRAAPERAYGTGYPRAPIMLLKDRPSAADLETSGAFADSSEALTKAFAALRIPISWTFGSTAVRCGDAPATGDQIAACATHLLIEIEAVSPRVIVVFGETALAALRSLDGRCGLQVPDEIPRGEAVSVRTDLSVILTEDLPQGVVQKDAKRRLWADLQRVPALIAHA
jgi:uracil-DNA glycosylase